MMLNEEEIKEASRATLEKELLRWRYALRNIISKANNIPAPEITDIVLERHLEGMERA